LGTYTVRLVLRGLVPGVPVELDDIEVCGGVGVDGVCGLDELQ
jgi:hypothetical protein